MTDGNTYAINQHLDDREDFDALQEVTAELEQAEARIEELEAKLAELQPNDGRPCSTDRFLYVILGELDDGWDYRAAVKAWVEGAWDEAVLGTSLAKLEGETE